MAATEAASLTSVFELAIWFFRSRAIPRSRRFLCGAREKGDAATRHPA